MSQFTCASCGGVYEKVWSDAEAKAEYRANMPEVPRDEPTDLVCNDCYERFMVWLKAHPEERFGAGRGGTKMRLHRGEASVAPSRSDDEEIKFVPIPLSGGDTIGPADLTQQGGSFTTTFTLNIPPWFPFTLHLGDCTITLHADGKWEGSIEALRTAMATGKAYGDSAMLLWLLLRQMEADKRSW
jgi:hypothetical protein